MTFELPALPYDYSTLEPHIDEQTMRIHHDKHHAAYVTNLNKALESAPDWSSKSIEEILMNLNSVPDNIRTAVRNNGGGHYNHRMFWEIMGANGGEPGGALAEALMSTFGSMDVFKKSLNDAGVGRFGSGWAWLVLDKNGKLAITSTPNQDNPISDGLKPIMGVDVWEHAYYLKYQNRRADYLAAWWNVVNWAEVGNRYNVMK